MKYPPFPFNRTSSKNIVYLDINKEFHFEGTELLCGIIKRTQNFNQQFIFPEDPETFLQRVEDFKENYDFNNEFEEKIK